MRFVKTVTSEFFHQVENFHRQVRIDIVVLRPFCKDGPLFFHLFRFFLTHCPTQQVSATQRVAGHFLSNLHYLLLIEDNAVGGLKNFL